MAKHSVVRRRGHGCLTGCLVRVIVLLGLLASLFVGACFVGLIQIDPQTGAPVLSAKGILPEDWRLPEISGLPALDKLPLPKWDYALESSGLTVKALRAGNSEALLVCADGYTLLLGAGGGSILPSAQLLLCGVSRLSAAVALTAEDAGISGMSNVLSLQRPDYLFYPDTQTRGKNFAPMLAAAEKSGAQTMTASPGMTLTMGRANITFVGPVRTNHTEDADDGYSLRIDYGDVSVLVLGDITAAAEIELVNGRESLNADVLFCRGERSQTPCAQLVEAVGPQYAVLTGKKAQNASSIQLMRGGAQVFSVAEGGVVTMHTDGQSITIDP